MIDPRNTKQEAGKYIKHKKKRIFRIGDDAASHVDKHLIDRLQNLAHSWRFVVSWLLLGLLMTWVLAIQTRSLSNHYTELVPSSGGTYIEGIVGPLTNMNPIYATTAADQAVSRLIFSSLVRLDENNNLVGDLAETIESDEKASIFTITLKDNLKWHDGANLTSQDVVFTVQTIQDSASRSPLRRSLEGVAVSAVDAKTVSFNLPGSFSPFPSVLTFGILPRHILQDISPVQLRSADFNSRLPIGSGPFKFQRIVNLRGIDLDERELKVQLLANKDYHLGAPRVEGFTFWVAPNKGRLTEIFNDGQLTGAVDLDISMVDTNKLESVESIFSQTSGVFLFFKNTNELLKDKALRQALTKSVNVSAILNKFDTPVQKLNGPLLPEQVTYTDAETQLDFNSESASTELDALGWVKSDIDGIRRKADTKLSFTITTQDEIPQYRVAIEELEQQFRQIGVEIKTDYRESDGFSENILKDHGYTDMLLYGINMGIDPDVYPFWHSTQYDRNSTVRLNLAEYNSTTADEALDSGRSRVEPDVRQAKYKDFLAIWREDAPAIALYRPNLGYFTLKSVRGPAGTTLQQPSDRFRDVHKWTALTNRVRFFQDAPIK